MATNNADDLSSMLQFDALRAAEELTGQSYKDDEATSDLGLLLHIAHGARKRQVLDAQGDTSYGSEWPYFELVASTAGYQSIWRRDFRDGGHPEQQAAYWHEAGLLLVANSYRGNCNDAKICFNLVRHERPLLLGYSGRTTADGVLIGDIDGREALRYKTAQLLAAGRLVTPWVERPFLWLTDYVETRRIYQDDRGVKQIEELTAQRIAEWPAAVQKAIGA